MKIFLFRAVLGSLLIFQFGCGSASKTEAENYKDAHLVTINDSIFLKLKGKRVLLHGPGTYEDSVLIPISKLDGRIEGKDIPATPGNYKRSGYILIDKNVLTINLSYDNFDDKRIDPSAWNGEYNLVRN